MESVSRDRLTRTYVSFLPLLHSGNKMRHYRRAGAYRVGRTRRPHFLLLPPTKQQVHVFASVRLSVCLLARLLKKAFMDLHEMLRVDRCRDMDNWLTFQPDPHYNPDAGTALLFPILYERCNTEFYYVVKILRIRAFKMVLFTASHRNTFVGGTCALPSALLVRIFLCSSFFFCFSSFSLILVLYAI